MAAWLAGLKHDDIMQLWWPPAASSATEPAEDLHVCRFGNESRSSLADMRLSAESEGPWSLATAWEQTQDGSTCLTYSACKAGAGSLSWQTPHGTSASCLGRLHLDPKACLSTQ